MKVVVFSDVHGDYHDIKFPPGDLLIFAGDFSSRGTLDDVVLFDEWLGMLDYEYKVIIAGNHDIALEKIGKKLASKFIKNAVYLEDEAVIIKGINIYGTPYQPEFNEWSFNMPRDGKELQDKIDLIPNNTDILITHNPPYGILDNVHTDGCQGCKLLMDAVVNRVRPLYHVFGHLHLNNGVFKGKNTTYINCSIMNEDYDVVNSPISFDI